MAGPWEKYSAQPQGGVFTLPPDQTQEVQIDKTRTDIQDTAADNRRADADQQAKLYEKGLRIGANGQPEPIPGWVDPEKAAAKNNPERVLSDLAKTDNILTTIAAARALVTKGGTTGWSSYGSYLPDNDARDLSGYFDTIRSNLTFDRLQEMRDNSPTGGAVGNASDNDMRLLGSTVASLDQAQSKEKILDSLNRIEQHYKRFQAYRAGVNPDSEQGKKTMDGVFAPPVAGTDQNGPGPGESYRLGIAEQFSTEADKRFATLAQSVFDRGASFDEMQALSRQYGYQGFVPETLQQAIKFRDTGGKGATVAAPQSGYQDPSIMQRAIQGVAESPVGTYFGQAANTLLLGGMDEIQGLAGGDSLRDAWSGTGPATAEANLKKNLQSEANPMAALAGNVSGGIIGTLASGALTGAGKAATVLAPRALAGDALFGGAYGAGETNDNRLGGAVAGAVAGAGGGAVARGTVNGIGNIVGGVGGPAAYLRGQGVTLTPGQIAESAGGLGSIMKRREDRLAGFSGIGDIIASKQRQGLEQYNRAAFRQGLETAREVPPTIAEEGIQYAENQIIPNAYEQALGGKNFVADQQFTQGVGNALQRAQSIPSMGGDAAYSLRQGIEPYVDPAGNISGKDMQRITQDLTRRASRFDNSQSPVGPDVADVLRGAVDEVGGMVERQAPGTMGQFRDANTAYRNLQVLKDAVARAINSEGVFTPAQLGQAARTNAKKYGGKYANPERPFFELQRAGQQILPSQIPDSGTAGRQAAGDGLAGAVRSALRNLRAPLYSDPMLEALNIAAISRPASARAAGDTIRNNSRYLGLWGVPAGLNLTAP